MNRVVLVLMLLFVFVVMIASSQTQSKPPAWEYKFEYKCNEKKADALGAEGWELVSLHESGSGISALEICGFKRPKN